MESNPKSTELPQLHLGLPICIDHMMNCRSDHHHHDLKLGDDLDDNEDADDDDDGGDGGDCGDESSSITLVHIFMTTICGIVKNCLGSLVTYIM